MPFSINFPKFNPGVTLTSAPFQPAQQVVGDPRNAAALRANMLPSSAINPAPVAAAPVAARSAVPKMMSALDYYKLIGFDDQMARRFAQGGTVSGFTGRGAGRGSGGVGGGYGGSSGSSGGSW